MVAAGSLRNTLDQASRGAGLMISKWMLTCLMPPCLHTLQFLDASASISEQACQQLEAITAAANHSRPPPLARCSLRKSFDALALIDRQRLLGQPPPLAGCLREASYRESGPCSSPHRRRQLGSSPAPLTLLELTVPFSGPGDHPPHLPERLR
jgi:hypothetical protein